MSPQRIQRKRTKGWTTPLCSCGCGQKEYSEEQLAELRSLAGHDLVCWCPLFDKDGNRVPCHADVLLELANQGEVR